jgi:DNA polymerase-3 subunit gamma/tau
MLTAGASNALLKTLEEPPSYVIFILATTEVEKIQVTIRSRCQRYDFHRIDTGTIVARMAELMQREGVEAEEKALRFVARAADGSMRDALSLLDQCMAFYMGQSLTYDKVLKALGEADTYVFAGIVRSASRGDTGRVIRTFEKQIANGMEISQFVTGLIGYLRNLLLVGSSTPEDAGETVDATEEQMEELFTLAESVPPETVMRYIRVLSELQSQMRYSPSSRVLTEVALIRISRPQTGTKNDDLLDRIRQMESRLDELLSGRYALPVGNIAVQASAPAPSEDIPSEEPPENAAPEDLVKIRSEWRMILSLLPGGFGKSKTILTQAKPQYDAENPGNHTLYVECSGIADRVVTDEELKKQLERIIEQRYQKHVDVEMHMKKDTTGNLRPIQADEILSDRSRIAMAVEVSDEDF